MSLTTLSFSPGQRLFDRRQLATADIARGKNFERALGAGRSRDPGAEGGWCRLVRNGLGRHQVMAHFLARDEMTLDIE
jgi:hypothetical protein